MLKQAISEAGYKQAEFARLVGIERPVLSLMCHGHILPNRRTAQAICGLLKKPFWELFDSAQGYLPDCGAEFAAGLCIQRENASQTELILRHLQTKGSITSREANELYGCTRLSGRIWDLRHAGHVIEGTPVTVRNRYGRKCRVTRYTLAQEEKE